ncbi:MAG: TetR/AcrR family transcriptional regulator [Acidimicrobiia bacterium]|nr:TetR/AcrR family transcriptional regulator [Acidimicrobiia bacterium]
MGRPKGPRRDPIERRDELLDACVRAIRTHGPDVSMAELAAEAGVTRPILYDHFGDRSGIATALVQRYAADLGTALAPVVERAAPFRDLLRDGIDVFCRFVDNEPALWRFLQSDSSPSGEASIEFVVGRLVTDALGGALRRAGADDAIAPVWSAAILGAVFLAAETWSTTRGVPRRVLVERLTALLVDGIAATGAADVPGPF